MQLSRFKLVKTAEAMSKEKLDGLLKIYLFICSYIHQINKQFLVC